MKNYLLTPLLCLFTWSVAAQVNIRVNGSEADNFPVYSPAQAIKTGQLRNTVDYLDSLMDFTYSAICNYDKIKFSYDEQGLLSSFTKFFSCDYISWFKRDTYYYSYFPDENMTQLIIAYSDTLARKMVYYFNDNDQEIMRIDSLVIRNVPCERLWLATTSYDSSGRIVNWLATGFNEGEMDIQINTDYSYTQAGNLLLEIEYHRNDTLDPFEEYSKEEYYYLNSGLPDSTVFYHYSPFYGWEVFSSTNYTYNDEGRIATRILHKRENSGYRLYQLDEYFYDSLGNPSIAYLSFYRDYLPGWQLIYKKYYYYDYSTSIEDVYIPAYYQSYYQDFPEYTVNKPVSFERYSENDDGWYLHFKRDYYYAEHTVDVIRPETSPVYLFPNPASGRVQLSVSDHGFNGTVRIYNQTGQLVRILYCTSGSIDISALVPGLYILETELRHKPVRVKLIVK